MGNGLEEFARAGRVVVFAGAGVSAGRPSALPGWRPLNQEIVGALRARLETAVDRKEWLADVVSRIGRQRDEGLFPPDYQAQIIEEMCGDRYFRGLQALDIDAVNSSHEGIAALAAKGALRAIVTTNFDRLIEIALERRGIAYEAAFDDAGYRLSESKPGGPLPVIKIHGSVSDPLSMIDTLKQRKRGRSDALQSCLAPLFPEYWLYLGFSAADLETDASYLGLIAGAAHSAGATYVKYPRTPALGPGAQMLMDAYGDRGTVVTAQIAEVLGMASTDETEAAGPALVADGLSKWADGLSVAATGLCLAAILEAAGESEAGVRVLDRLVRKEIGQEERETADYRALQLHYGRLGAAFGRFIRVPDLNGVLSNASEETGQSLMRLQGTEYEFASHSWLACYFLWMGMGNEAMSTAARILLGFREGNWRGSEPATDEEAVDAWLSAAQAFILNTHTQTLGLVMRTFPGALERARHSGDVVRAARVAALYLLASAEAVEDVPAIDREWKQVFDDAHRVGDGFATGFRELAIGRWLVGGGGLRLAQTEGRAVPVRALEHLHEAARIFEHQGMDPWGVFTGVQQAKAQMDLGRHDELDPLLKALVEELNRFPILASHVYELVWQLRRAFGHPEASESYQSAIDHAAESGLDARVDFLKGLADEEEENAPAAAERHSPTS